MSRLIDLSGSRFGMLVVERRAGRDTTNKTTWQCRCDCGATVIATGLNLKVGNTKSCGCIRNGSRTADIRGKRIGRLTAVSVEHVVDGKVSWRCKCDCGAETVVSYAHLSTEHTKSCGCYLSEVARNNAKKNLADKKNEAHPRWRSDFTAEDRAYFRPNIAGWRTEIMARDKYLCVKCQTGGRLHAHHLEGYAANKALRLDLSNGVTLCRTCHRQFHSIYGISKFTRADFFVFIGKEDPGGIYTWEIARLTAEKERGGDSAG